MAIKNFFRTVGGKLLLFILAVITVTAAAASIAVAAVCAYAGVYTSTPEEIKASEYEHLVSGDSYDVIFYTAGEYDNGLLHVTNTNLKYAVYDGDKNMINTNISDFNGDPYAKQWRYRAEGVLERVTGDGYVDIYFEDYDVGSYGEPMELIDYGAEDENYRYYVMYSYVDENLPVKDDYFTVSWLVDAGYAVKDAVPVVAAASLILLAVIFTALMCVSARRPGDDEVHPGALNRVPFDLMLALWAVPFAFGIAGIVELADNISTIGVYLVPAAIAGICLVLICLGLGLCMSIAARIKDRSLLANTVIWRMIKLMLRLVKWFAGKLKKLFSKLLYVCRSIPLIWKTALILAAVILIEMIVILSCWYSPEILLVLWIAEKLIICPVIILAAINLRHLQKAGEALAGGNLKYKADTKGTFWDFRRHAENLNSIADGMSIAVEDSLKSERMKTELITNVSHDIKTPLTSIINYADLIGREQCDNEKVTEYSAVLLRQSERLKRLIEDLVEASKASTGTLDVTLLKCDANVFISQTAGEYEDKLAASGLSLVTKQPEAPVFIMADGRRMLRIFDNLMNNICKYAQSGTRVYLTLEHLGDSAVITFKNTSRDALNISADELMERFVRGDASRNTEGSGLGLSIAKSIAELQGGSMSISIDGDLFKVTLTFPAEV